VNKRRRGCAGCISDLETGLGGVFLGDRGPAGLVYRKSFSIVSVDCVAEGVKFRAEEGGNPFAGVLLFRVAGGVVALVKFGAQAPHELLAQVMYDASTALLIFLAMAFGLIVPKLTLDHFPQLVGHG
jgi:hypothetical protein